MTLTNEAKANIEEMERITDAEWVRKTYEGILAGVIEDRDLYRRALEFIRAMNPEGVPGTIAGLALAADRESQA